MADLIRAISFYAAAKEYCKRPAIALEVAWQRKVAATGFTETDLLREAAWVILCSGFKEATVRSRFDFISLAFCDWESASEISRNSRVCIASAECVFRNLAKLNAIVAVAEQICAIGFSDFEGQIRRDPLRALQRLPYVGPITAFHLAKNLGFPVAKPDRHLVRLGAMLGYDEVDTLCRDVAAVSGSTVPVVDLIFWRYLADHLPGGATIEDLVVRACTGPA